jgi:hypothetical protein
MICWVLEWSDTRIGRHTKRFSHEHGGDSRPAGNHANVSGEVGSVLHLALGTLDLDNVADLELAKVL